MASSRFHKSVISRTAAPELNPIHCTSLSVASNVHLYVHTTDSSVSQSAPQRVTQSRRHSANHSLSQRAADPIGNTNIYPSKNYKYKTSQIKDGLSQSRAFTAPAVSHRPRSIMWLTLPPSQVSR
eukprot:Selendium_serpulae@DN5204_c0_g1_i3.p1